jgi:signal transduction histidine kinase
VRADSNRAIVLATEKLPSGESSVAVRDSGAGIDPAAIDRIFTPFYTTKSRGMGMGLSISRSIIEAHGGRLWAARNEGPGTTFRFAIPVRARV